MGDYKDIVIPGGQVGHNGRVGSVDAPGDEDPHFIIINNEISPDITDLQFCFRNPVFRPIVGRMRIPGMAVALNHMVPVEKLIKFVINYNRIPYSLSSLPYIFLFCPIALFFAL